MSATSSTRPALSLLADFSLEITGKDSPALVEAASLLSPGTAVNVTYLRNESAETRLAAVEVAQGLGLRPVPHLSARRLTSESELRNALESLAAIGAASDLFLIGGDPSVPEGPFADALSLIRTGMLKEYGVRSVGIAGYPEGHPNISNDALWAAMLDKVSALKEHELDGVILTQFGFDSEPVAAWIRQVRERGIDLPIRVGVPGPTGARRLLSYARRFGVQSSTGIIQKYGLSLTNLVKNVGPDAFVDELAARLDGANLGQVGLHFYTFGGVRATAEWVRGKRLDGVDPEVQ